MWLTLLLRNWYWIAILSLTCAVGVLTLHGRALKAERDEKIAVIDSMKREAQTYQENSIQIAKEISDAHKTLAEQTEKNAYANYLKRYGKGNAACGISNARIGVLPTTNTGEANSPERTDEPTEERIFVESCAFDAGTVILWQDWAKRNQLPVQP